MQDPIDGTNWFFVDESGDPTFYDRQGNLIVGQEDRIYFSQRGSRLRQAPLERAIQQGVDKFESRWNKKIETRIEVYPHTAVGEPCLQVIDYMNWAVYRAFVKREMRYYRYVQDKVSLLVDRYDSAKYPKNWYTRENPFDIEKASPL